MYSDLRGSLKIRSKNPFEKPSIRFNYLSTGGDKKEWVETIRVAKDILSRRTMNPLSGGEISLGPKVRTDEETFDWVRKDGEIALHPSYSARVGPAPDSTAAANPLTTKVRGMESLCVVDASAVPCTTDGNMHAPALMLAKKTTSIIRGRESLEPQYVDYCRYGVHNKNKGTIGIKPYAK